MSYDALVVGAGPAGSTAALLLARAGWSVAIVEKTPFPRRKVCGEFISAAALTLLARMGLEGVVQEAGPEIREVAVYAGERTPVAPMPRVHGPYVYGRALGRDRLDAALLQAAAAAGAVLYQPYRVDRCERRGDDYICRLARVHDRNVHEELEARVLIAAHGTSASEKTALDLLAFEAHFSEARLAPGRMPLVAFPGGYGGLVHTDRDRVSFSCCIRRDALAACRAEMPRAPAGAAVLSHVLRSCRGARQTLSGAAPDESWLAAGPLSPGIRRRGRRDGYFAVGDALGEAHPIVAEGISMAIQSAWLLCARLSAASRRHPAARWSVIARAYEADYRARFAPRIHAAAAFAALAMRPRPAAAAACMLDAAPALLAFGARCAGKATALRPIVQASSLPDG